jgi:glycyl-tRNA synthetase beta chain
VINELQTQQPDKAVEKRGPSKQAAFDAQGQATRALTGFTNSLGINPDQLEEMDTPKGTWLVYRSTEAGHTTQALIGDIVNQSLADLPIPKRMRWGAEKVEFVRPVQWIVMLLGNDVVEGKTLGIRHGKTTRGHRFHSTGDISIESPSTYAQQLLDEGKVIADYEIRKEKIRKGVTQAAENVGGLAIIDEDLLDEVCALNEWPVPLVGKFDVEFLQVPAEALISSMKEHQKYFHALDGDGKIMPLFITLSNIESKDPKQVISGNERVIRPRLADAAFFFKTDKKTSLADKRELLKKIVFQNKLGTIYDKTERVAKLAERIALAIGSEPTLAKRAGELAKSDLVSEMVLEFTDLQGIMAYHYALHDGENEEVSLALNEQYMPKYAGGPLPSTPTGCAVSIAEKLDSLVGLFGINQPPSGTKDPFALRRASLGILRIIVEKKLPLDLEDLITWAIECHEELENKNITKQLIDYLLERFRARYDDENISAEVFLSVSARRPTKPLDFDKRIRAVDSFMAIDAAVALASANKRVSNILSKQNIDAKLSVNPDLLSEPAEQNLALVLEEKSAEVMPSFEAGDYEKALKALASLQAPVDRFFDEVMVMANEETLRNNRIALLQSLRALFLHVADISLLSR